MTRKERALIVKKILGKKYPNPPIPLNHFNNFSFLIAVLLSAQCTDERVNQVTPKLFKLAKSPLEMSKLSEKKIYSIILIYHPVLLKLYTTWELYRYYFL